MCGSPFFGIRPCIAICVGGVVVYVLWIFLAKVEREGGGCSPCKLGDGCVECGEDVCSVE